MPRLSAWTLTRTIFSRAPAALLEMSQFDPAGLVWTDIAAAAGGTLPTARVGPGLAALGPRLYLFGGYTGTGSCASESAWGMATCGARPLPPIGGQHAPLRPRLGDLSGIWGLSWGVPALSFCGRGRSVP